MLLAAIANFISSRTVNQSINQSINKLYLKMVKNIVHRQYTWYVKTYLPQGPRNLS
jgi:hypothetical protein